MRFYVSRLLHGICTLDLNRGIFWNFVVFFIQHCFICRPSDFTVSDVAGIEPRTVELWDWQSDALSTRLDIIHSARSQPSRLDLIHFSASSHPHRLDLINSRLNLIYWSPCKKIDLKLCTYRNRTPCIYLWG
jgi:hypothetical protein